MYILYTRMCVYAYAHVRICTRVYAYWADAHYAYILVQTYLSCTVKANSKEICEEISFPSFFRKMLMSAFLLRFKANYLEKMRGYPYFSLWIPIALAKIYFFCMVLTWRKNLCI